MTKPHQAASTAINRIAAELRDDAADLDLVLNLVTATAKLQQKVHMVQKMVAKADGSHGPAGRQALKCIRESRAKLGEAVGVLDALMKADQASPDDAGGNSGQ